MGERRSMFLVFLYWFGKTQVFCLHTHKCNQNHVVHYF